MRLGSRTGNRALVVYARIPPRTKTMPKVSSAQRENQRAGVVVGKRQVRKAVDRNLVKRRIRHLLKEILPTTPPGSTVVVRGLGPALKLEYSDLADMLTTLTNSALAKELRKQRSGENCA